MVTAALSVLPTRAKVSLRPAPDPGLGFDLYGVTSRNGKNRTLRKFWGGRKVSG